MFEDARIPPYFIGRLESRQLSAEVIRKVLSSPEQVETVRPGRVVVQSRVALGNPPRLYLIRVFVDVDRTPPEVVTVYRTSKIEKYWRQE